MDEKTYIFEGKTTNEAIEKGLKELKVTRNKVDVKVIENEEKKTFFSILEPKVVKVEIKLKSSNKSGEIADLKGLIKELENFMKDFIANLPTKNLKFEIKQEDDIINIHIKDDVAGYLIGHRGETLNALQNILCNIANKYQEGRVRIVLNIANYREKREKDLVNLAKKVSESVIKTRKSIALEPMPANDRRIIHNALQKNSKVRTHSIGKDPYRKVIISLK